MFQINEKSQSLGNQQKFSECRCRKAKITGFVWWAWAQLQLCYFLDLSEFLQCAVPQFIFKMELTSLVWLLWASNTQVYRLPSPQYEIWAQELSLALTLSGTELRIAQRWWVVDVESKTTWDNTLKGFTVDSASLCSLNEGGLSRPRKKEKYLVFLFEDDQTQLFDYDFSMQVLEVLSKSAFL